MRPETIVFALAAAVLTAAIFFGGGAQRGLISDAVPELLALPLIFLCIGNGLCQLMQRPALVVLLACILLTPLVQLVPLPAEFSLSLPGREDVSLTLQQAGVELSWFPISLRPPETWRSFLSLLPATALCLAAASLDLKRRVWLIALVVALVLANVVVGFIQIIGGPDSAFYLFTVTNSGSAVGFFANANHYTALLYATLPLAVALFAERFNLNLVPLTTALVTTISSFLIGLAISGSRTALILGSVGLVSSLLFVGREAITSHLSRKKLAALAAGVGFLLVPVLLGVGVLTIFRRFSEKTVIDDARWVILQPVLDLMKLYAPVGSGIGTFERAYQTHETASSLMVETVNHAHNDWLELAVEGGLPVMALLAVWLIWLALASVTAIKQGFAIQARLEKAAFIALWLLTIHSLWDYPLRTIAVSSVFGLCIGILVAPPRLNIERSLDAFPAFLGENAPKKSRRHRRRQAIVSHDAGQ